MATVQHSAIVDPNIHEPKGIATAISGTAYIADGSGSGSWEEVVTPSGLAGTPTVSYSATTTYTNKLLKTGVLFPLAFSEIGTTFGDHKISHSPTGFLKTSKSGIYLFHFKWLLDAFNTTDTTITPTKYSGSKIEFTPNFSGGIFGSCVSKIDSGFGFGLWVKGYASVTPSITLTCYVTLTRLSDA